MERLKDITISVDTTELDAAIEKVKELNKKPQQAEIIEALGSTVALYNKLVKRILEGQVADFHQVIELIPAIQVLSDEVRR